MDQKEELQKVHNPHSTITDTINFMWMDPSMDPFTQLSYCEVLSHILL
jgi:hypothetical protein